MINITSAPTPHPSPLISHTSPFTPHPPPSSPVHSTKLSKLVPQFSEVPVNRHVNPKHPHFPPGPTVHHRHVHRLGLLLGEGQGDTDVRVKGTGTGSTGWADEGGTELALKQVLNETVVELEMRGKSLSTFPHLVARRCPVCVCVCVCVCDSVCVCVRV